MLDFAMKVARESGEVGEADFAALRDARLHRRGRWDIARDRRVLRAVEPHGQRDGDAPERRVLSDGAGAEVSWRGGGGRQVARMSAARCGLEGR